MAIIAYLTACAAPATPPATPPPITLTTPAPTPRAIATATPQPTSPPAPTPTPALALSPTPAPTLGTVSGDLCYPSSQTPPLTLYLTETKSGQQVTRHIERGERRYQIDLPPGEYVAYAQTVGTEVWGGYTTAVGCPACQPSRGAGGQGGRGAREQGSRGAGEQGSKGAREQGGRGDCEQCQEQELLPFEVAAGATRDDIDLCDWEHPPGFWPPAEANDRTVMVTTIQNTNLYPAPTLATERLVILPPRLTVKAVARTTDNAWLQIETPGGDKVWLYDRLTQVKGNIFDLPMLEPHKTVMQILADYDRPRDQFSPTAWSASKNEAIVHFRGFIRDKYGRPVNGYSVLLDNGTWSVLSHPSGASRHYPDTGDGAWDLIIKNASDAAGWWALTVVSYDCPDFETGFNAQCKQFTPLSETQIVQVVYPDENVIHADWICRRDCDRGLYVEAYRRPEDIAAAAARTRYFNYVEDFYRGDVDRLAGFYPDDFFEPKPPEIRG